MGVFVCVCMCVSGWSSPVSLLLIVLYCSALAAPEGRGWLGGGGGGGVGLGGVLESGRFLQAGVSGPVEKSRRQA